MSLKIVVIDDEKIVNTMVANWLATCASFHVVGSAFGGVEGLEICGRLKPDIAVLDVRMPDMDGFDVVRKLKVVSPETRVVILSSLFDPYCIYQVVRLHIPGYVDKGSSLDHLETAIREVGNGKYFYSPVFNTVRDRHLARPDAFHKLLTPRETAVLIYVASGMEDEWIGHELGISVSTVATHRRNLRQKLKAHNDRGLLAYARKWGLMSLSSFWPVDFRARRIHAKG